MIRRKMLQTGRAPASAMARMNFPSGMCVCIALAVYLIIGAGPSVYAAPGSHSPAAKGALNGESATSSHPTLEQRYPRYAIQRQDVLQLNFPITPELNQTVTVQPDGYIDLENAASLHVQGMTVPELTAALKKAYEGTLHNPIISVELKDFQKPFFTVSGQVGRPGKYNLRDEITVAEGIAIAGGLAPTAKTQIFLFHRVSDGWFEVKKLNLKDVLNGKHVNEDATLRPGDMIYVPETFISKFRKYVPYSVSAGSYLQPNPF